MQRLLLVDRDPRSRLVWLDCLRDLFEVQVVQAGELPIRRVRKIRPSVVIVSVHRGGVRETVGWSRVIKTDSSSPPVVGIHDPSGRIDDIEKALEDSMADTIIRGKLSASERKMIAEALLSGTADSRYEYPTLGWRRRLWGGFR